MIKYLEIMKKIITNSLKLRTLSITFLIAVFVSSASLSGQEQDAFKPGGKSEARIFSSLNTTFSDGENHTKFDITRAYFGYNYNFTKKLSARVVYDVADPSVGKLKFTGMLKFAYLKFQSGKWIISGGMIPLPEYDNSDRKWGYRYIYKTFHDEYGFGVAADLGVNATYNIASWISADLTLMNGEGFKLTEADSTFKAAAGITLTPVKGLFLRGYFDNMTKNKVNQQTVEIIAAYENKGSGISVAYNFRKNHGMTGGQDYQGFTLNGTLVVTERIKLLGRYDYLGSEKIGTAEDPWNLTKDGQLFIGGVEFALAPGVNISPNFQGWNPADPDMPFVSRLSISMDIKF